jgi:hypothetical protein
MSAAQEFEFSVTYDETAVRAAAAMLFRRYVKSQLPLTVRALLSLMVTAILCWYYRVATLIWGIAFFFVVYVLLWGYSRWRIQWRLMKRLGKSAQIRLTVKDFSIAYEGESHTLPWSRVKFAVADDRNLYLFITKAAAYPLPSREFPAGAEQFAISRVQR